MKRLALCAFLVLTGVSIALAQSGTATVLGTVKDASGASVPGATVTMRNVDTGQSRTATSGADGAYRFDALPVGNYESKVEQTGFKTAVRSGVTLTVTQQLVMDYALEVGEVSQQVEVTEKAEQVNTTSAVLGAVVDEKQVVDLPLNGRNYIQLALLQSGIAEQKNRNSSATANLASQGTYYSSNGAPTRSNRYLLDGTNMAEYGFATASSITGTTLGLDGIREFRILSSSFDAEYGMVMGSQMVVVSKSGANAYHGDVFDYLRNSALNARNFNDTAASAGTSASGAQRRLPPFRQSNFGGSFGGPIQKDKTFYYAVYEGIREIQGISNTTATIPAGCRGPVGATIVPTSTPGGTCSLLTAAQGSQTVDSNVAAWLSPTGAGGLPPIFPLPNVAGTNNVSWAYGSVDSEDYGQMRVDRTFSSKDNMFARYTINASTVGLPEGQPGFPTFPTSRGQWLTIGENHIISPSLLNTATVGYSRSNLHLGGPIYYAGGPYTFSTGGPASQFAANGPPMGGSISITSVASNSFGGLFVSVGKQGLYSYSDDLFYTRGRHSLKFGALINHYQIEAINGTGTTGSLSFASMFNLYTEMASSYALNVIEPGQDDRLDVKYNTLGFYVQDDIRATSRLTLNLGFRYEPNTNMIEIHGRASTIRNWSLDANETAGSLMMQDPSWHNFSPRVGFAYDPWGDGKTAIRGGISYMQNVGVWIGFMHVTDKQLPEENAVTVTAASPTVGETYAIPFNIPAPNLVPPAQRSPTQYEWYKNGQLPAAPGGNVQPRGLYYNLSVQRQLPWSMAVTVAYVGARNYGLTTEDNGNPAIPLGVPGKDVNGNEICVAGPSPYNLADQNYTDGSANACWMRNELRINPNWGSISTIEGSGQSWYNSLQATVEKRVSSGLQFQGAFTWSRLLDTTESQSASDGGNGTSGGVLDSLHPENDRAPANFNLPLTLRINMIYNFPTVHSNKLVNGFLNGWRVSPIFQAQSGSDFDLGLGNSRSAPVAVGYSDQPDWMPGRNPYNATHGTSTCTAAQDSTAVGQKLGTPTLFYDPCAFYPAPLGFLGDMQRDSLRGPDYQTLDLSFVKETTFGFLGETANVEFRVEGFNILNRANLATPSRTVFPGTGPATNDVNEVVSNNAGRIIATTLSTSRQLQLALKFSF